MKKALLIILIFFNIGILFSQTVEKLIETTDIHTIVNDDEFEGGKSLGVIWLFKEKFINNFIMQKEKKIVVERNINRLIKVYLLFNFFCRRSH